MKKILFFLVVQLLSRCMLAQQLHIHHINIENGDATLIGIYDEDTKTYTSKILIDGGQVAAEKKLLPYIAAMIGEDEASFHFNYVLLTHYHKDHYEGLLALKNGKLTADSIIDPGGYRVSSYFNHSAVAGSKPDSLKIAAAWLTAIKTAAKQGPEPFVKGRSKLMLRYDTGPSTSIGNKIVIGRIGDTDVELECIAGWGNTLSGEGKIKRNPGPKKSNPNNFTLAFILSCGEFRYFIGGDMGGSGGSYIDQETSVTAFLNYAYPASTSISGSQTEKGHVCGFKANHHGSNHSNNAGFMEGMHPSIVMTSAGDNKSWHLPHPEYIKRLETVLPLYESEDLPEGVFNRGVYFTNLYNFTGHPSLKTANKLFKDKPGISYSYGNTASSVKKSYLIKIKNEEAVSGQSKFEVGSVDISKSSPYEKLASFRCHKK